MRQKNLDLGLALLIALLNICWAFVPAGQPVLEVIRAVLALPLALFLPGYMLTEIIFYRRSLDFVFLLALWFGLSFAITIIGGLVLNTLSVGLMGGSWSLFLALVTTVFVCSAALLRRRGEGQQRQWTLSRLSFYETLLVSLAVIIVTFSYVYAANGEVRQPHPGYTRMWMLPASGSTQGCAVQIAVNNFEGKTMGYRATMTVGETQAHAWPRVVLADQGTWSQRVTLTPTTASDTRVVAQLYRLDTPQKPYRQVHLTLTTCRS